MDGINVENIGLIKDTNDLLASVDKGIHQAFLLQGFLVASIVALDS
jgi:hypothetical protein